MVLDKQVNAQKGLKIKLLMFMQAPASPQKVCNENESGINDGYIKYSAQVSMLVMLQLICYGIQKSALHLTSILSSFT